MSTPARQGGRRWRDLRAQVLLEEPFCAIRGPKCTRVATTVDHIRAEAAGGAEFDRDNCRGACAPCNYGSGAAMGNRWRRSRTRGSYDDARRYPPEAWLVRPGADCPYHGDMCGKPSLGHLNVGWG